MRQELQPSDVNFYYIRAEMQKGDGTTHRRPVATVAIQQNGENVDRAVAVCSSRDNFSKESGRRKALHRLRNVSRQQLKGVPINKISSAQQIKSEIEESGIGFLSEYNAAPTEFEKKIIRQE